MYAIVTGSAGFIGSHLAEELVKSGQRVLGVDCLTDYYDPAAKWANLAWLRQQRQFEFAQEDLRSTDIAGLISGADVVFHQAAQPGVRNSFAEGFPDYCGHNIIATQRLLEAAKDRRIERLVYASSSSIYGNALRYPTSESDLPQPFSPYGVTKLAAEHLCTVYGLNWSVPTVSLRYFSVYGPRQRPDMAMYRLIHGALTGRPFPLYGDGGQVRDFTYVGDVVQANLAAATASVQPGCVMNIAGQTRVTVRDVIELVADLAGHPVELNHLEAVPGDVRETGGSSQVAEQVLGWSPGTTLREGLEAQLQWMREMLR